jgi:hypothetical protein
MIIIKWILVNGVDWIDLAQHRDQWRATVNTVLNLRVRSDFGKFFSSCKNGGFSRSSQLHGVSSRNVPVHNVHIQ